MFLGGYFRTFLFSIASGKPFINVKVNCKVISRSNYRLSIVGLFSVLS